MFVGSYYRPIYIAAVRALVMLERPVYNLI
jgi:hypothetical protein